MNSSSEYYSLDPDFATYTSRFLSAVVLCWSTKVIVSTCPMKTSWLTLFPLGVPIHS